MANYTQEIERIKKMISWNPRGLYTLGDAGYRRSAHRTVFRMQSCYQPPKDDFRISAISHPQLDSKIHKQFHFTPKENSTKRFQSRSNRLLRIYWTMTILFRVKNVFSSWIIKHNGLRKTTTTSKQRRLSVSLESDGNRLVDYYQTKQRRGMKKLTYFFLHKEWLQFILSPSICVHFCVPFHWAVMSAEC